VRRGMRERGMGAGHPERGGKRGGPEGGSQ
jgi:hypothetical protein